MPDHVFTRMSLDFFCRSAILMELSNNVIGIEAGKFLSRKITKEEEDECNPNKYDDTYFIERMKHSTHLLRSDYSTCIKNWMKYIPSNQILLVNYKDLSNQPNIFYNKY